MARAENVTSAVATATDKWSWRQLERAYGWPVFVFLLHQSLAYFIVFWSALLFPHASLDAAPQKWIIGFFRWDAVWYLSIAQSGYTSEQATAFFPLYPWSMAMLHAISGISLATCGLLLTNIFLLGGLVMAYRYVRELTTTPVAKAVTMLVAFCPISYFYAAAYSESLFLLLSVSSLYCIHKKNYLLACTSSFLITLSRPQGICIILAVLPQWWYLRKDIKQWIKPLSIVIAALSGIGLYMIFLTFQHYHPLAFVHAQRYWWREPVVPGSQIMQTIRDLLVSSRYKGTDLFMALLNVAAAIWIIASLAWHARSADSSSYLFVLGYVLMTLSSSPGISNTQYIPVASSMARYLLVLVPVYMWCVPSLLRSQTVYGATLVANVMLYTMLQIMFALDYKVI